MIANVKFELLLFSVAWHNVCQGKTVQMFGWYSDPSAFILYSSDSYIYKMRISSHLGQRNKRDKVAHVRHIVIVGYSLGL